MSAPFVALDGTDGQGVRAEVWVQSGTARIDRIAPPRNWSGPKDWDLKDNPAEMPGNVTVKFVNEHIREGINGWISTSDPLFEQVKQAYLDGRDVAYRVEWQRNRGVDRTTPVKELRGYNEQTKSSDMGMSGKNGKNILAGINGMLTKEAVTNPAEDPDSGGRHSAVGQETRQAPAATTGGGAALSVEAALTALATARAAGMDDGVVNAAAALALTAGATAKQVNEAGVSEQSPAQRREVARAHAKEATPYTAYNTDGRLNLGSDAVQAVFGAERFAHGILAANRQAVFEQHNADVEAGAVEGEPMEAPEPVTFAQSRAMAKVFLDLADRVQVGAYGGGRPDRMARSHTRARSLVYQIVETSHPVPFGAEADERTAWMEAVVTEAVEQFQALASLAFPGEAQQPAQRPQAREQAPAARPQPDASQATPQATQQATQPEAAPAPVHAEPTGPAQAPVAPAPAPQEQAAKPPVPAEGQDGFVAPAGPVLVRFGTLVADAGFDGSPESPVVAYLQAKFGVSLAKQVHGPALEQLTEWYEKLDRPALKFREHVIAIAGEPQQSAQASA